VTRPRRNAGGREVDAAAGTATLLFGGSGFLGPYILGKRPGMISVGRRAPRAANRHMQVDSFDALSVLEDVWFDKVIFIIGNTDHHNLEKERLDRGEPDAFDYHLVPFVRVIEQLKHRAIKKFIHCSTVLIYDQDKIALPVSERAPIDPYRNRYVLSKYLAEEACKYYARWVPIINVRFSNLYGPTRLKRFDLIHVLCRGLLAEAILQLVETDYTGTVNLGTGTMSSVREVIDILEQISGGLISVRNEPVDGPMQFRESE
jgi:nucleoside-diphosphate-sugar epimerase